MNEMNVFFMFVFLVFMHCSSGKERVQVIETKIETSEINDFQIISKETQAEQISCSEKDCITVDYSDYSELDEKIHELMAQNAGKIFIQMKHYNLNLNDEPLVLVVRYFKEISEREGKVSIEPYYIAERTAASKLSFSFVKDTGLVGFDLYKRIRDSVYYRHTKNYNAKVLYHPKYYTVMMIFFIHKNYGDVCQSVFSDCTKLEYLDDDSFDLTLSNALRDAKLKNTNVQVFFRQEKAKTFKAKLDKENIKQLGKSIRLYKWLILAKETHKKPLKKERFVGANVVVTVLDYSLTLYDLYKQYKIYEPVLDLKAELIYTGSENGGSIESVVFYK